MHWRSALVAVLAGTLGAGVAGADCPLFLIERQADAIRIVREELPEGGVRVFRRNPLGGVIDVVLPVGPGQSANFVAVADTDRMVLRCSGGRLSCQVRRGNGQTVDLPARDLDDLRRQDIRVSVTAGDGLRRSFVISGYGTVLPDTIGPTQNLFAGLLPDPVLRGGVVIQTDTYARPVGARLHGRVPLERAGYLFARGRRPDGVEGWFIVDLAASESVVARLFLPAGQEVRPLSMSEHSASGTRTLPYSPGGATGTVETVAGAATLPALTFGDLRLTDVPVTVLERMPEGLGRPVAGILGIDVLRRCDRLRFEFPADSTHAELELSPDPAAGIPAAVTPFSWVASHLMVRGTLDGVPMHWILDSGSPRTVIDSIGAPPLPEVGSPGLLHGLGAAAMAVRHGRATSLTLSTLEYNDVPCDVAPLTVFAPLREPGYAVGVLGLSEIARSRRVEVDFAGGGVRWFR